MKSTGKIIYEVRMKKGLSQEELAEMAKVNLKTIQRIESDLTAPRETTINLIFGVLEIDQNELKVRSQERDIAGFIQRLMNVVFIVLLNITIAAIIIYLTAYDTANIYTKIASFFLCMIISYVVVLLTRNYLDSVRVVKFGAGFILVIIFALFQLKTQTAFFSGAIPSSVMALAILFYGDLLQPKK